jgi:hypothetical protein
LNLESSNLVKVAVLLAGVAHVMIFMNGYWNDLLWLTAILSMGIPIVIHKFANTGKRKSSRVRLPPKDL